MKTCKNYIKMQAESMSKYLEETVVNSANWVKVSNDLYFLLFIEKFSNI